MERSPLCSAAKIAASNNFLVSGFDKSVDANSANVIFDRSFTVFSIRGLSVEVAVILVSTDIVEDVVLEAVAVATVLSASFLLLLLE
ncbi:hypothetical protein [Streptococcus canis]|uniref:hypothetical protein n=1 Tax=Streptococcus canis TaxID=1329 RepID=UPI000F629F9F|nr:hypothetical protein [Streptococcus canis]